MAIITVTLTEHGFKKVANIPEFVTLETNIPCTIFYTLDGTEPSTSSDIYVDEIIFPINVNSVSLRVFATNGVDSSEVLDYFFGPDWKNIRVPHAKVIDAGNGAMDCAIGGGTYDNGLYTQPAGITVKSFGTPGIPDGYDAFQDPALQTDKEYNLENYEVEYSETNSIGQYGNGIGTLPAKVVLVVPDPINKSANANSKLFNPKSMVIIQDGREPPQDPNVSTVNKQYFSTENIERVRDGSKLTNRAFADGSINTGSFIRPFYNARENTYTFYYRDAETNRWIISIEPMPKPTNSVAMQQMVFQNSSFAEKKIFRWIPFKGKILAG